MLDLRHVSYLPLHDPLLQVVGGESGLAIEGVMIGGRWALRDGRVLTVDEERLRARVHEASARLTPGIRSRIELSRALEPFLDAFCLAQAQRPLPNEVTHE
jgi:hypothetical protein